MTSVISKRHTLSDRQREVLRLLAEGYSQQEIGEKLGYSSGAISHDLTAIKDSLHVPTLYAAMYLAGKLAMV